MCITEKKTAQGGGEIAQWLRVLAALPENLVLIPSAHMVAYNHLELHFR